MPKITPVHRYASGWAALLLFLLRTISFQILSVILNNADRMSSENGENMMNFEADEFVSHMAEKFDEMAIFMAVAMK